MEELKRFQGSRFDTISRRRLIEDRDTVLELTGKIQELQNEINCMHDSRDSKDAESVRSGQSYVTCQQVFFPHQPDPGGLLSRSVGMPSRNDRPTSIWDTHGISGIFFANSTSSSAPYPVESNPWVSNVSPPHVISESQTNTSAGSEMPVRTVSQRFSHLQWRRPFKELWTDQQRLQISDPHFDKLTTSATFACWKIRFQTEVCTCSQFPTEATLWIKEVVSVDSVDDLKSSSSVRGIRMPDFELDAKIASALNRIIHKTQFKKKDPSGGTKSTKRGPFPSWKTDRLPDRRVLTGHWSQRFSRELCRHNCSSK